MQPGLFELLLSFKVTNPEASEGTVLQIGNDSCLKCILDMISPSQQVQLLTNNNNDTISRLLLLFCQLVCVY